MVVPRLCVGSCMGGTPPGLTLPSSPRGTLALIMLIIISEVSPCNKYINAQQRLSTSK